MAADYKAVTADSVLYFHNSLLQSGMAGMAVFASFFFRDVLAMVLFFDVLRLIEALRQFQKKAIS
jgi:hypothetical protein